MAKKHLDKPVDKEVLSELALYQGYVDMPKKWDLDPEELIVETLNNDIFEMPFGWTKTWERLNTYLREYLYLKDKIKIVNEKSWGEIYQPREASPPLLQADFNNLKESPDAVVLYGTKVKKNSCSVVITYDDKKFKNLKKTVKLDNNKFIMFPAVCSYYITTNRSNDINFINTITYKFF
tara:strand:+ start:1612 stop:2148 length:537 start_codon:yes stop_codon:yes gene_type:complete